MLIIVVSFPTYGCRYSNISQYILFTINISQYIQIENSYNIYIYILLQKCKKNY